MNKAEVIDLKAGEKISIDKNEVGYSIFGPATVIVVKKEAADAAAAVKCQYHQCKAVATEYAIGYDEAGDDHVYHVCLEHAATMQPQTFGENWRRQNQSAL